MARTNVVLDHRRHLPSRPRFGWASLHAMLDGDDTLGGKIMTGYTALAELAHGYVLDRQMVQHIDHWDFARFTEIVVKELASVYGTTIHDEDIVEAVRRLKDLRDRGQIKL
jgi:hypothetical protein